MSTTASNQSPSRVRRSIPVGATEAAWPAPDGQGLRMLDWPAAPGARRGSLLFMPGRGDVYEKWLESLGQWHDAGWNVSAADWRGQGYSGRLGCDALTGHIPDFAVWVDDYAAMWADWSSQSPGPHVAVAHSMGGHIVLRAVAEGKVRPDAIVLSAPMLGLHPTWLPSSFLHLVARTIANMGDPRRAAWSGSEKPEIIPHVRSRLLTHDLSRYGDEEWWRHERPAIEMGAASWGWIERALASIRYLETPGVIERIDVSVLVLATHADGLVSWPAIRRAAARLPRCELVVFGKECRHEILREADPVRDRAMDAIGRFLDRVVAAGA